MGLSAPCACCCASSRVIRRPQGWPSTDSAQSCSVPGVLARGIEPCLLSRSEMSTAALRALAAAAAHDLRTRGCSHDPARPRLRSTPQWWRQQRVPARSSWRSKSNDISNLSCRFLLNSQFGIGKILRRKICFVRSVATKHLKQPGLLYGHQRRRQIYRPRRRQRSPDVRHRWSIRGLRTAFLAVVGLTSYQQQTNSSSASAG